MKSFKEYLLEGQEEVDAAIKATEDAHNRERKIWYARGRLETMIADATNKNNVSDSEYSRLNRKAHQKVQQRVNPMLKKTFTNLSPEDRMQFLLSPRSSNSEWAEYHDKYSPGGAAGQTMYDKIKQDRQVEMFPLKDLRDAEDLLSVVRSKKIDRSFHPKDRNLTKSPITQDRGDNRIKGGTFHERKKMRTERNKTKSSKK